MRRLLYLVLFVLFTSGSLGCSWIRTLCGGFKQPTLTFDRVELVDVSLTGITVNIHFNLKNDNPVGVKIARLSYNFEVENRPVISGHPPNGLDIKPDGVSNLAFPAHVNFQDLAATLQVFWQKNTASYSASGEIGIQTPLGILNFPLSHSGTFPVPKPPDISVGQPTLNNISLSGAHLTVPILVHNKNFFPLPFDGLSTQVTVSGAPVVAPSIPRQSALAAGEQRVLNLGVDVSFANAGFAVASALRNHQANIGLRGSINVGGINLPINLSQNVNLR